MKITTPTEKPYLLSLQVLACSTQSKHPVYNIYVNDQIVTVPPVTMDTTADQQQLYTYKLETQKLDSVTVELLNKEPNDTTVVDQKIIDDLYIVVKQLQIDNINIGIDKFNKISNYQNKENIQNTFGFMGFNGKLKFKIHKNLLYTLFMTSVID